MSASVISPEIFDDEWFGGLSDREMLVWIGIFSKLRDDQGRFVENAALARARLFPYRDVPVADVQAAFDRFVSEGRLHHYADGDRTLLQIVTWWQHQRPRWASPSQLPAPDGWVDRTKHRENGRYVSDNWEHAGGFARTLRTNPSHEPFVLAHEPEPEPEPEPEEEQPLSRGSAVAKPTPADWEARSAEILQATRFPDLYRDLASMMAEDNKTGRVARSRVVRVLYSPLLAFERGGIDPQAMEFGLSEAIAHSAPNATYVKKAAASYAAPAPARAGAPQTRRSTRQLDTSFGVLKSVMSELEREEA